MLLLCALPVALFWSSLSLLIFFQYHATSIFPQLPRTARDAYSIQRRLFGQPLPLPTPEVQGWCDDRFLWVKKEFERSLEEGREIGAQVAAYANGELVVDLWAGSVDHFDTSSVPEACSQGAGGNTCPPLDPDKEYMNAMTGETVVPIFSSGKVGESLVMGLLSDQGLLDLGDRVATHWPQFAANGKESITVADLMRHQGGLAMPDEGFRVEDIQDPKKIDKQLARQHLHYTPESGRAPQLYHAVTRGMYANELVRRVDPMHRNLGTYFREEVAEKYDIDSFFLGISDAEWRRVPVGKSGDLAYLYWLKLLLQYLVPFHASARSFVVAGDAHDTLLEFEAATGYNVLKRLLTGDWRLVRAAVGSVKGTVVGMTGMEDFNNKDFLQLQMSSANGLANARSMAKLGNLMLKKAGDGGAFASEEGWRRANEPGERQPDYGVQMDVAYTACGWGVDRFSTAGLSGWSGWAGASGSVLQWNEALGLSFAYTTVLPYGRIGKPRGERLMKALVRAAGGWVK